MKSFLFLVFLVILLCVLYDITEAVSENTKSSKGSNKGETDNNGEKGSSTEKSDKGTGSNKGSSTEKSDKGTGSNKGSSKGTSEKSKGSEKSGSNPSGTGAVKCFKDGKSFSLGLFIDPADKCKVCDCCALGSSAVYTCVPKTCPILNCGLNMQKVSKDGCCMECDKKKCKKEWENCETLTCPHNRTAYDADSCCPECGCSSSPTAVPPGQFGHKCENCTCDPATDTITCNRPSCPLKLLECMDPTFDKDCNYVCPNEKTCREGAAIIKYSDIVKVGDKFCTCNQNDIWYTRGFCALQACHSPTMKKLMEDKCMAKPSITKKFGHLINRLKSAKTEGSSKKSSKSSGKKGSGKGSSPKSSEKKASGKGSSPKSSEKKASGKGSSASGKGSSGKGSSPKSSEKEASKKSSSKSSKKQK